MSFSAVILAGGASRRMGCDKSHLQVQGQTLLARQIALARQLGASEVWISGRPELDYSAAGCPVLLDAQPGCGPLAGIERALAASASPLLLVMAVDLPHLTLPLLQRLLAQCARESGVVPELGGHLEPLVAFYPKRAHPLAAERLARRQYAAREFALACVALGLVKTYSVSPAEAAAFTNWNRPQDIGRVNG